MGGNGRAVPGVFPRVIRNWRQELGLGGGDVRVWLS